MQQQSTLFCGKKSLHVNNSSLIQQIKQKIKQIGSFNLSSKYYTFLSKKNVNNLKESSFLVSLRSFGKNFILFVTKLNDKNYCIFINKKNESMNIVQFHFNQEIYDGTMFDGELVKNNLNNWIFIINDIAYYKGKNIITERFTKRQSIINNILQNEYKNNNNNFYIIKKDFFGYEKINDLVDKYQECLNYKHSGLYFKNVDNFSDNYLFIFPECRTDSKILNNGITIDNQKVIVDNNSNQNDIDNNMKSSIEQNILSNEEENLFGDTEFISSNNKNNNNTNTTNSNTNNIFIKQKPIQQVNNNEKLKLNKITCNFLINPTNLPDVYELYCYSNNNAIEKYSYAAVPDINTSKLLKELISFNNINDNIHKKINNNNIIYVECNYHKKFKKWVPFKKADNIDSIQTINQTQIILDSL